MTRAGVEVRSGDVLDAKYRIDRLIGQGGMGSVYAATHLTLERAVAIKVLNPALAKDAQVVLRFVREAKAAAKIGGDHVARVLDVAQLPDGSPYIVSELLEGFDLETWLQRDGPLPVDVATECAWQAAHGLARAHAAGVIHRDIKPSNLFATRREDGSLQVKLVDFGISKLIGGKVDDFAATKTHEVFGSPMYMSPEQIASAKDVDARSDLWSLGVVLFELLTGRGPFSGESTMALCAAILRDVPARPTALRSDVPPALEKVILSCLEKDASRRPRDAAELASMLEPFRRLRQAVARASPPAREPVTGPSDTQLSISPPLLFGRARELTALRTALEAARASRGSFHLLVGEPGIGKTRLADAVADAAEKLGMNIAWGRAWETGGAPPFFPWSEVLAAVASGQPERSATAPDLGVHRLAPGDHALANVGPDRMALFQEVVAFLRAATRERALLLVLDDLHAADVPSLELLHFVVRGLRSSRLVVLVTTRDAEARDPRVADVIARVAREGKTWPLERLTSEEVAELVAAETRDDDGALATALMPITEGNPLFVHEALGVVGTGGTRSIERLAELAATAGIAGLVRARMERLPAKTQEVVTDASVLGRRFDLELLAEVLDCSMQDARAMLDESTVGAFVRRSGPSTYVFTHALIQQAILHRLPADRRRILHARAFHALRRRMERGNHVAGGPALAAHHALSAVPLVDAAEVGGTVRAAAETARRQLAPEEAVVLLERTRAALGGGLADDREDLELTLALGWALTEAGQLARGRDIFREAATRARALADPLLFGRAALGQGGEYVPGEVRDELLAILREAIDRLPADGETSRGLRARLLARLAAALQPSPTPDEPVALAREAWALRADLDVTSRMELALAVGATFIDFTAPEERIPVDESLIADARAVGDRTLELRGLTRLATALLEHGDFARADSVITQRAELANEIAIPRLRWQSALLRSMRAMPEGRFADCDAAIEEARAIIAALGDVRADAANVLARHEFCYAMVRGDPHVLVRSTPAVLASLDRMPQRAEYHAMVNAVVNAYIGKEAAARSALVEIRSGLLDATAFLAIRADVAVLVLAEDAFARFYAKLAPAEDRNTVFGPFAFSCAPPIATVLGALAAALGQHDAARAHFDRALAKSEKTNARAHSAWILLRRGETLPADHDAVAVLERAASIGAELGMPAVVDRAARALERARHA